MWRSTWVIRLIIVWAAVVSVVSCSGVNDNQEHVPNYAPRVDVSHRQGTRYFDITWNEVWGSAGYRIRCDLPSGGNKTFDVPDSRSWIDSSVYPADLYDQSETWAAKYSVCGLSESGVEGPWSNKTEAMYTRPEAPDSVRIDSSYRQLTVHWRDDISTSESWNYYRVYRGLRGTNFTNDMQFTLDTDSCFYREPAIYGGNIYEYRISKVVFGVEGERSERVARGLGAPPRAENLRYTYDTTAYTITVTWDGVSDGTKSLHVADTNLAGPYRTDDVLWPVGTDSSQTIRYALPGVPCSAFVANTAQSYYTSYSDTILICCGPIVDSIRSAVGSPKVRGESPYSMGISWNLVPGARQYRVVRADSLTGQFSPVTEWFNPVFGPNTNSSLPHNTTPGTYKVIDPSVDRYKVYFYRVLARNVHGQGPSGDVTYGASDHSAVFAPQPVEPQPLQSGDSVELAWSDPGNAIGFAVLRATTRQISDAVKVADSLTVLTFIDTSTPQTDSVYYWIEAIGYDKSTVSLDPVAIYRGDSSSDDDTTGLIDTTASDSSGLLYVSVSDSCTLERLAGARGTIVGGTATAIADTGGAINLGYITVPPPDTSKICSVLVSMDGYRSKTVAATVDIGMYNYKVAYLVPDSGCASDTVMMLQLSHSPEVDLDIHVLAPDEDGGNHTDVGYMTGNLSRDPWALKVDGEETVIIGKLISGEYTVFAYKNFGDPGSPDIPGANATLTVTDSDGAVAQTIQASTASGSGDYWTICTIDGGTGAISVVNTLSGSEPTP